MALNNQNINGDLSVQKDLNIGGSTTQQGDGLVKGNLEVKGWLIANKVRGDFVNKGLFQSEDELKALALASEKVKEFTDGKTIIKTIVVPKKLVNIVVK